MNKNPANAKYFFLELGIIVSMYIAVVSFITFAFDIINYLFPDRLAYGFDPYGGSIRFAISTLVIVFPIFVVLSRIMWKMLFVDVENRNSAIRRWLSFLTLFLAAGAIAGNLVTLVNTFLSGEISSRFICKVIVVLVVALGVFLYTLKDLRGVFFEKPQLFKLVHTLTSIVLLACIIFGFFVIGLPASQRDLQDDMTRSQNLQSMQSEVLAHYQRTGVLPNVATDLINPLYPDTTYLNDPVSKEPYEYRSIASSTPVFELCADFALDSKTDLEGRGSYPKGYSAEYAYVDFYPTNGELFEHKKGRNCFTRIIDPSRYPVQKPGTPMPL